MTQNMLALALSLASTAYVKETDKGKKPYFMHCIRVMNNLNTDDEELQQMAILHDVVEDKKFNFEQLREMGFSERVLWAIGFLTHAPENTYEEYINKMLFNKDAILVKLADLKDNSDITRLKGVRDKDFERLIKYNKAFQQLTSYLKEQNHENYALSN